MTQARASQAPPFCPNPGCAHHGDPAPGWPVVRDGFYSRQARPQRIQRYRCRHCGRRFSQQSFSTRYWLRRPELLEPICHGLVSCAGYRQLGRALGASPSTVMGQAARLGRHCLLVHVERRPRGPLTEPLVLDGLVGFEYSQYHPTEFHTVVGARSHYVYGLTESELRRSGRMTARQRRRRAALEAGYGRPHPRSREQEVAALLEIVAAEPQRLELHSDEHHDYPRALRRLGHLEVDHRVTSSRAPRTAANPLFPVNLWDLLARHSGANHKRETIAFSKRRQSAVERLWVLAVWRNLVKSFSESRRDGSPAMRLGLETRRWTVAELLEPRRFPTRVALPERWARYYWRRTPTRRIAHPAQHRCRYAA